MPLTSKIRYAAVLGRLFKIHFAFASAIAEILLKTSRIHNLYGYYFDRQYDVELNTEFYIVFISESISEWNELLYVYLSDQLVEKIDSIVSNNIVDRLNIRDMNLEQYKQVLFEECTRRIKFVDYSNYIDTILGAAVVLDTCPYGGSLFTVILI